MADSFAERAAARRIRWNQAEADALVAGVLAARDDLHAAGTVPDHPGHYMHDQEAGIDRAYLAKDLHALRFAVEGWFALACLPLQAYVLPVLSEWERAWLAGNVHSWRRDDAEKEYILP